MLISKDRGQKCFLFFVLPKSINKPSDTILVVKRFLRIMAAAVVLAGTLPVCVNAEEPADAFVMEGRSTRISDNWTFERTDQRNSSRETVSLPHDWSIQEPFSTEYEAESGFLPGGKAVYRKTLIFPEELKDSRVVINFGGVYMNAEVSVNNHRLGSHPYGYTGFAFDLTDDLIIDGKTENVIEVEVSHEVPSSRWYSGSGIYRDVYLTVTKKQYFSENGVQVFTPQDLTASKAKTDIKMTLGNAEPDEKTVTLRTSILDDTGEEAASTEQTVVLSGNTETTVHESIVIDSPECWSLKNPAQYVCRTELIKEDGSILDVLDTRFGYRTICFDADKGFLLNGEPVKLKGVCLHHDQGALGAASYPRAIDRQLDILQEMGINAVRTAHNPADRYFLESCSRRGILVIEEAFDTWTNAKNHNSNDYSSIFRETVTADNKLLNAEAGMCWAEYDIKEMVRESVNEPCIILYSIGNEILGNIGGDVSEYPAIAAQLCEWINETGTSVPVTIADNMTLKENEIQEAMDQAVCEAGGVIGLNYATAESMDAMHENHPEWPLFGSETVSAYGSRGEYRAKGIDSKSLRVSAYDTESVEWGTTARQSWLDTITRDYIAGEFVWTGFDYIGEPEPWNGLGPGSVTGTEPIPHSSYFGIVDTAGIPKDSYYFYQSQWRKDLTVLHILPDWNQTNIQKSFLGNVPVSVYTNAASIELFLNGKSLGRKDAEIHETAAGQTYRTYDGKLSAEWNVRYKTGELKAVAYDENGEVIQKTSGRSVVRTNVQASRLILECDRTELSADGRDLAYLTVALKDRYGNVVSDEDRTVTFELEGSGVLLAADNGNPADLQGYQDGTKTKRTRDTFHGKAVVIVKSTQSEGTIRVRASAEDLPDAEVVIEVTQQPRELSCVDRLAENLRRNEE